MPNQFYVDPTGGINLGGAFQNLGSAIGGFQQRRQQEQLMQQQQEQQAQQQAQQEQQQARMMQGKAAFQEALQAGDAGAIAQLSIEYPEMSKQAQDAFGFTNDVTKKITTDAYTQAALNPQNAPRILKAAADQVTANGGNPENMIGDIKAYIENPDEAAKNMEMGLAAINPEVYKAIQAQKPTPMTEYQQAQTKARQVDADLKRAEVTERQLDREIKRETNTLKREELQSKLANTKVQKEEVKAVDRSRIENAVMDAQNKQGTISELLGNEDYIDSLTGYQGRLPAVTDSGIEAEGILDNIKNSMTIENLSVMSGPLTDKDIQVIASASSRLNAGMSGKALKKELNRINSAYDRVIKNYNSEAKRKGYETQPAAQQAQQPVAQPAAQTATLSDADLLSKYGG